MKKAVSLSALEVKSFITSLTDQSHIRVGGDVLTQYTCPESNPYDCPQTGGKQSDVYCIQ